MYVCMYVCMYVYMYICIYAYMYICVYVYMYVCTYVSMYVCMCVFVSYLIGIVAIIKDAITTNTKVTNRPNEFKSSFARSILLYGTYIYIYTYVCMYVCMYKLVTIYHNANKTESSQRRIYVCISIYV